MSAVSMNVTPRSSARRMVAMDWSQSAAPYHSLISMQPRPCAETVSSPSLLVRILLPFLRFAHAARVIVDLEVEQLEAFPLAGQRTPHFGPVAFEQLQAFGLAGAGSGQFRVALHVLDRHAGVA